MEEELRHTQELRFVRGSGPSAPPHTRLEQPIEEGEAPLPCAHLPPVRSLRSRNERPPKIRSPKGSRCRLRIAAAISPRSPAAGCGVAAGAAPDTPTPTASSPFRRGNSITQHPTI